MRIELEGLVLRTLRESDAPSMAAHANDRDVWRNLRDSFPFPYTVEDARSFIEQAAEAEDGALVLGLEVEGAVVGACGVHPQDDVYRRSAEVGYWLGRAFHGRGLATKALGALTTHAFATMQDVVRLYASVFAWNPASARVLEKCGYVREGVLRSSIEKAGLLTDSWLYARLRSEAERT